MAKDEVILVRSETGGGPRGVPTAPEAVSGVQLAQGIGVQQAKGFWADAWSQVLKQPTAVAALVWLSIVGFFAVFAPLLASGHPLWFEQIITYQGKPDGTLTTFPLFDHLRPGDIALPVGTVLGLLYIFAFRGGTRASRLGHVLYGGAVASIVILLASLLQTQLAGRDLADWARQVRSFASGGLMPRLVLAAALALPVVIVAMVLGAVASWKTRAAVVGLGALIAVLCVAVAWDRPLSIFDYHQREVRENAKAVYTVVPWSPSQRFAELDRSPPMTTLGQGLKLPEGAPGASRTFVMGTDALGQDVLANILHASRLAISIGFVSTGIAVVIGVTLGALMGYFGGWVDLLLFRLVEIFQAVPLLFLLIVAAAVLPPEMRSTYVMMAIIGCFTWTGAARFTRAEFLKLRNQDFVQSAKAVGLPLRSILFKHMLPNGVTPVLVDASFAIAAAITIEATLSFLGLGPADQASWGKLLSSAISSEGQFKWWLAVFPGMVIFLTVLSYNLLGEALRDAIDPKLKKARV